MSIRMIGIDHTLAEVAVREIFSFTKKQAAELMEKWKKREEINGLVLLSTCNRLEIYFSAEETEEADYCGLLCEEKGVEPEKFRHFFCHRTGREAVRHLLSMTAGLESLIVGEDQILGQVKEALSFAREYYAADKVLEVLFRQAVTTGKEVKTKTPLSRANLSSAGEAVESLKRQGAVFAGKKCLVIGNGAMGKLTAQTLLEEGADVTVTVRQYHRGIVDIPPGARRIGYAERYEALQDCNYIFSATSSPNLTLTKEKLLQARMYLAERNSFPQKEDERTLEKSEDCEEKKIFVDLAVPRDIEPEIGDLPGITLYDVDDFSIAALSPEMRRQQEKAMALIEEGTEEFESWFECRELIPAVNRIAGAAAADICGRLEKPFRQTQTGQREKLLEAVAGSSHKVAARMLFALRDGLDTDTFRECLEILEQEWKV